MIENISVKVDDVGRIVIPKKVRKELDINIDDVLLISVKNKKIEMQKRENNDKLKSLIKKLEKLIEDYCFDVFLTDNQKVIFSNIDELKNMKIKSNIKKLETNNIMKMEETILTDEFEITEPHYYCSFYLDIYTKYNLFIIYKNTKTENIAKIVCELLII